MSKNAIAGRVLQIIKPKCQLFSKPTLPMSEILQTVKLYVSINAVEAYGSVEKAAGVLKVSKSALHRTLGTK